MVKNTQSDRTWSGPDQLLAPLHRLHLDERLVVSFFFAFSRFEFALKQIGCLQNEKPGSDASPNWTRFSKRIAHVYDPDATPQLSEAVDYILSEAPKKQIVLSDSSLGWQETPEMREDTDWVLTLVRRVRNNPFHRGKYAGSPAE